MAITSSSPLWLLLHRRHYGYILLLLIAITGYIIFTPSLPYLATALLLHCHIWLQYYSFIAISDYSITTSLPYLATVLQLHCHIWLQYYNFIVIFGYNIKSTSLFNTPIIFIS
ncbi:hypothetical protein QL285_034377 [Trifolium repens]|nr:hypothetical protein QL285_034377 [Trifolium repens]